MQKVFIIGRQPDPSYLTRNEIPLIINESKDTEHVSRTHSRLIAESNGKVYIEDLNSTGGTYVNGARISHITQVHPHSRITLGKMYPFNIEHPTILRETATFNQPDYEAPQPVAESFEYASWGQRFLAMFLDGIVLSIIYGICRAFSQGNVGIYLTLSTIMWLLYFGSLLSKDGKTLGKRIVGIKVLSLSSMKPPSYMQAVGRTVCYWFSFLPILLGFMAPLWTEKKQAFHDSMVGTIVVKA